MYDGGFLKVSKDRVVLPDGSLAWREYVRHPGAVAILALTADGRLVLERQYRHAPGRVFLEIPAGKIDPHESTADTARRELLEETGLSAANWICLGTAHPCIGYADEEITYFLAQDLSQSERRLDEGEFLEVLTLPLDDVFAMALSGEICDSKSLVGLFWLRAHREGKLPGAAV